MIEPINIQIPELDTAAREAATLRQAQLTKPSGALGKLEALSIRLAAMRGRKGEIPADPPKDKALVIYAADHGVAAQGVSAYPQEVTRQMVNNFIDGGAAANVLARQMGARMMIVDAGVIGTIDKRKPGMVIGKVGPGTADFTTGRAMTGEQALKSLDLGDHTIMWLALDSLDLLAIGEMGIGNTTSAAAIIAAITGKEVSTVVGRGTGVDDAGLRRKITMIERALVLHELSGGGGDGLDVLEKVGGFEIGAMAGAMLKAASMRIPVVLDGLISTAAALIAAQIAPRVTDYLIAGHRSTEPGHRVALDALGLDPLLDLHLRLGEGSGALLAFPLIEAAIRTLNEMATFDQAGVSNRDDQDS